MTNTVLTDEQKAQFVTDIADYGTGFVSPLFDVVDAIEQAVLQSPEVLALISAVQEFSDLYGWLWDATEGGGFLSPDGVKRYDAAHHNLKVALCKITGRALPIDPDENDE